jgi:hypothetical protein
MRASEKLREKKWNAFLTSHNEFCLALVRFEEFSGEDLLGGRVVLHALGTEPGVGRHLRDLAVHPVVCVAAGVAHLLTQPQHKNDSNSINRETYFGSGSINFWASRIRIRSSEIRIQIWIFHHQANIVRKRLFLLFCDFFMTFYLLRMM